MFLQINNETNMNKRLGVAGVGGAREKCKMMTQEACLFEAY